MGRRSSASWSPTKSGIDRLNELGVDLAEYVKPVDNGIEVHAVPSPEESQALRDMGFDVQDAISDQSDYAANVAERAARSGPCNPWPPAPIP